MSALAPARPEVLLLDAGYTLVFPDGGRIAEAARRVGLSVAAAAIEAAEATVRRELQRYGWPTSRASTSRGTGAPFFRRYLELAAPGVAAALLDAAAEAVWGAHLERNVWGRVGAGVADALARLRAAGVRLAVVSNSEGTLAALLSEIGLAASFEVIIDSWDVGVSKPDPRIFHLTLERLGVAAGAALMVGDTPATDVDGARAAGVAAVLVDPLDLHADAGVPRYADLGAVADALLGSTPSGL